MTKKEIAEMEANIRNYSNEIKTIEDFVEAVRRTIGQYLGYVGNKGFMNMVREILQNSIDELMKSDSPCNHIKVSYDERNNMVGVLDNGRGLPFPDIIRIFTAQHTSSNYVKKAGEFSSGRHGVGSKVTNAASSTFTAYSYILGEARMVEFIDGKPTTKEPIVIPNPNNMQGALVQFTPCYEVMGKITTTCADVLKLIQLLLPLLKIGAVIDFDGIDLKGKVYTERLVNEDGIITNLINKTTSPVIPPVVMSKLTGIMKADIAFTYDSSDLMMENITAFSNFCPTISGTHVDGFLEAITKYFREYMNKIYLTSNKLIICNNDIRTGLKCIIAVSHLEPLFTGQAKEILSNEDMFVFVRNLVKDSLDQWVKENPGPLQKLCKYYKDVAEIRVKSDDGKVKLSANYQASVLTGLPKKYHKPNGKTNLELVLLEGDSALGSAEDSRCHNRQGLFPLRGKIPNAFSTERKKFINNEEISGMLAILGGWDGRRFDITKCLWEKIIILTDGDVDGKHIRSLLLRFFIIYCPDLIIQGRIFGAVPPLYGIKIKGKYRYFTEKLDYVRHVQSIFSSSNNLCNINGSKLTNNEAIGLLFANMEYAYDLEMISNTYAINPYLLEKCLVNRGLEYKNFKKVIEKEYRFLTVEQVKGITIVKGLFDSKYQTAIFNDKLVKSCTNIINYIDKSPTSFLMNNEAVSLYELMKAFESSAPSGITRYKGIGEMNPDQLGESALHPDSDRTLLRYTIEDVKAEIEAIRYIESNKSELLKDLKVSKMDVM